MTSQFREITYLLYNKVTVNLIQYSSLREHNFFAGRRNYIMGHYVQHGDLRFRLDLWYQIDLLNEGLFPGARHIYYRWKDTRGIAVPLPQHGDAAEE